MRLSWLLWGAAAVVLAGCNGLLFWKKPVHLDAGKVCEAMGAPASAAEPFSARMELQNIRYDGRDLTGRLLVSPVTESLCLDKRFIEEFALVMDAVAECDTGRDPGFFVRDVLAPPLKEEDVLVLKPGYWYGKDVAIFLFSEQVTGKPSPECIEAEFTFHALNFKNAARLRVRAVRTPQPLPDTGTPTAPSPAPDAGAPIESPPKEPSTAGGAGR